MLAKPGSGGGGGRLRATASTRRKTAESPDDAIRKLSKQPANKRCADCTTKVRTSMRGRKGTNEQSDSAPGRGRAAVELVLEGRLIGRCLDAINSVI